MVSKPALVFFSMIWLNSCSATYFKSVSNDTLQIAGLIDKHTITRSQSFRLHRSSKIYLKSLNFSERSIELATAAPTLPMPQAEFEEHLYNHLSAAFPHTFEGKPGTNLQDAFMEAMVMQADYLIYPYLARDEDQLNSYREIAEGRGVHPGKSYARDKTLFTLTIFDVYSQQMLDVLHIHSNARWLAGENNRHRYILRASQLAVRHLAGM